MNEFLAAPASFLPSELIALVSQLSCMHFFMKEDLAAPARGLPSLPIALLSQLSCANAELPAKAMTMAANAIFLSMFSLRNWLQVRRFDPRAVFSARKNAAQGQSVRAAADMLSERRARNRAVSEGARTCELRPCRPAISACRACRPCLRSQAPREFS